MWYSAFSNLLSTQSASRAWTWCEVQPDAIIGFTPNGSTFSLAAHWATYLSLYAHIEGPGANVPFAGTASAYESLFNEASADIIARFGIWASLHPEKCGGGQLFNIGDSAKPARMSERWPALAAQFGLNGVGPVDDQASVPKPSEYVKEHVEVFEEKGIKTGQVFQAQFLDS